MTELQRLDPPADNHLTAHQPSMTAQRFAHASSAPSTQRAYRADWHDFVQWCDDNHECPLPASSVAVANYLSDRGVGAPDIEPSTRPALAVSTLERRLVSIARAHQLAGHSSPVDEWVRSVMKGIRRERTIAQRRVEPVGVEVLRQTVAALPDTLIGTRDAALLLLGFAGAFRRSELAALDLADVHFVPDGMTITVRRSKTDQQGEGMQKGIPYGKTAETCPVRALQRWIKTAKITNGPLFRPVDRHGNVSTKAMRGADIALVVKRSVAAAGFEADNYSGHSLRAGLATAAASVGADMHNIRRQTGHRSDRMLEIYIREGSLFRNNVAGVVGL